MTTDEDRLGGRKHMTAPVMVKADSIDEEAGTFEAIVSVFNNIDSVGDVVMPGAFSDDLAEWAAKGDPIPVIWSHRWEDPEYHVGLVLEAKETDEGLWVKAQIDLDESKGQKVFRLLKGRRVTQFSFAYDILDGAWAERDGVDVYELRKLHVHEVGPTLIGANRDTRLLSAKADEKRLRELIDEAIAAKADDLEETPDPDSSSEPATHPDVKSHPVDPRLRELAALPF